MTMDGRELGWLVGCTDRRSSVFDVLCQGVSKERRTELFFELAHISAIRPSLCGGVCERQVN